MTIWIDADSCPSLIRNYVVKYSNSLKIPVYFVANKKVPITQEGNYKFIICPQEKDSADNYIFENSKENDLVITKDIIFANRLIEKKVNVINDRGTVFTADNIKEMLSERDFDFQLAQIGLVKHYNEGYNKEKFSKFANCFDKTIHQLLRK